MIPVNLSIDQTIEDFKIENRLCLNEDDYDDFLTILYGSLDFLEKPGHPVYNNLPLKFYLQKYQNLIPGERRYPDNRWAVRYAARFLRHRWPEIEPYIIEDYVCLPLYIDYAVDERLLEYEHLLTSRAYVAEKYAEKIIGGRWTEAEAAIMKNPWTAYRYSKHILKDKWIEAEKYISQNPDAWEKYQEDFKIF